MLTTKLKLEAGGTATYVLQRLWLSPIRRFTWFIHDHFLRHVLGSGANNDGLPQLPPLPLAGGVRVAVEPHHEATTEDSYIVVATAEAADPHIDGGNGDSK